MVSADLGKTEDVSDYKSAALGFKTDLLHSIRGVSDDAHASLCSTISLNVDLSNNDSAFQIH